MLLAGPATDCASADCARKFDLILAERGRIARELHDTLIQGFAGITMAMQALASRLPRPARADTLEEIVADAGQSLREARQSLAGLRAARKHRSPAWRRRSPGRAYS